jgi:predicted methyltransferase
MDRVLALFAGAAATVLAVQPSLAEQHSPTKARLSLSAAVAGPARSDANRARDRYRHPLETLTFFGVEPDDTVVEIWPGGGWYSEILAPYLRSGGGKLVWAAAEWEMEDAKKLQEKDPALYGSIATTKFPASDAKMTRVPDGSADVVLTFRNVHNWRMGYRRADKQDYSAEAFRQMYAMLKPGGVLGITDHRLPEGASTERELKSGYIKASTVRRLAEAAGFRFAGSSEVNANPKDTADWPNGVWTLPPTLALKDQDRKRYLAIGESDRMTLKFVKPH